MLLPLLLVITAAAPKGLPICPPRSSSPPPFFASIYDAAGMRLEFYLLKRGPKTFALTSAPSAEPDSNLDDDFEWLHNSVATSEKPVAKPLYFVKTDGAWAESPFPLASQSQARCTAAMTETNKLVVVKPCKLEP